MVLAKTPFIGPAYALSSSQLAGQQLINLYVEFVEDKLGKGAGIGALYSTPGLTLQSTIGNGPIRGMHVFQGKLWVVTDSRLIFADQNFNLSFVGNLSTNTGPVSFIDNGTAAGGAPGGQIAVFDGAQGYVVSGGAFSTIALPFVGAPVMAAYQDDLGVLLQGGTQILWQSNVSDFTMWNALNFNVSDGQPDNVVAIISFKRQLIVLKADHGEVWINTGSPGFVFQRLDGVYLEVGCVAPFSLAKAAESLLWVGQNEQGQGVVFLMTGYQPKRISTFAQEQRFTTYNTLADAVAYAYFQAGHLFYVLTFPTGGETWVLDLTATEQAGEPMWHQRAYFSNGVFSQHRSNCHAFFTGLNLVGDYQSGLVYSLDRSNLTDNGQPLKRLRSWRAKHEASSPSEKITSLEFAMETGVGIAPGATPQLMLRWSDDGGASWSPYFNKGIGGLGQTAQRVKFNRLGAVKRGLNEDRVFEVSATDPFFTAFIAAELNDGGQDQAPVQRAPG